MYSQNDRQAITLSYSSSPSAFDLLLDAYLVAPSQAHLREAPSKG